MVISQAPRMAPTVIRRPRLEDWFVRSAKVPVRFVVGPAGSGKTTALLSYLRSTNSAALYCSLKDGAGSADVRAAIADVLQRNVDCASLDDVIRGLAELAPLEFAIDRADAANQDGIAEILRLIEAMPEGVSLLVACKSRIAVDVGRLVARGIAALCDAERLLFDSSEIRHLAETCDVSFTDSDVTKLLENTDGWPIVVSNSVRKAAEDEITLAEAFERWRNCQGHLFAEFVTSALESAREDDIALVRALIAGTPCEDQERLNALEMQGLFVVRGERGCRPLAALSRLRSHHVAAYAGERRVTPMHVRMLGRFQVEIDGREVEWIRRRDSQVFKYIALKHNGKVTRAELAQTFWPGVDRHLVAQSVRTACCNIRKAIARIVGFDTVDRYFRAGGDIALELENVVVDVKRFLAHVNDGDQDFRHDQLHSASSHYRMADQLYTSSLLSGEPAEEWFTALAATLENQYVTVLERLSKLALALGELAPAVRYARRVMDSRPESDAARAVLMIASRQVGLRNLAMIETLNVEAQTRTRAALGYA